MAEDPLANRAIDDIRGCTSSSEGIVSSVADSTYLMAEGRHPSACVVSRC